MFKRILFTFLILLTIYSGICVGYRAFQPENADIYIYANNIDGALDLDSLKEYTISSSSSNIHYFLFFEQGDNDSIYVINTVLRDVQNSINMDLSGLIEKVDIGDGASLDRQNLLKSTWGIESYPAFVACHVNEGEIIIDNTLVSSKQQPINDDQLIQWLILNDIYNNDNYIQTAQAN